MTAQPDAILDYWFGDSLNDPKRIDARNRFWFQAGKRQDQEIRERFGAAVEAAAAGELDDWAERPRAALALILLLDQFTRNLYRGQREAFAGDPKAQQVCLAGIERGLDRKLAPVERVFFYMPLEHAEDCALQDRSLAVFKALAREAPEAQRPTFDVFVKHAREHRETVHRFGRFPHRNGVLGREPTPEEDAYLGDGGKRYGQ